MTMTSKLPIVMAVLSFISAGIVSANFVAQAEPAAQTDENGEQGLLSPKDRAAFLDARIAAVHAGLGLTAEQEKLWPPVEQAYRDFAKLVMSQIEAFRERDRSIDPITKLKTRSDNMIARGEALKKLATAAGSLYAGLSEDQKHRVPFLVRAFHPGRLAMIAKWRMERRCGQKEDNGDDESGEDESK
jgi:zinc resistance-associated protein